MIQKRQCHSCGVSFTCHGECKQLHRIECPDYCDLGESWLEPCFGKYRNKPLCGKCDKECRSHKLYRLRQWISVHVLSVRIFIELLIGNFLKFFINLRRKNRHA